jgi:putative spermidine/putrescine transport system permease protein
MNVLRGAASPLALYVSALTVAMVLPIAVVVLTSLTPREFLEFPPSGLSLRWYVAILESGVWTTALQVSLQIALIATSASLVIGVMAALGLRAASGRWSTGLQTFFLSPLMIPSLLIGLGLLRLFDEAHIRPSILTVAVGHTMIATPYVIRYVLASLAGIDPALERASAILGAGAWRTFRRITLPLMRPGIVAGALFSFIMSVDDVNIALFLSDIHVLPFSVKLMGHVEQNADPLGAAVASILVILAFVVLLVCDRIAGIDWMFGIKAGND